MSGGEQLRDYLPVAVAACHLVDLALLPQAAGTVNVCSGQPTSVRARVEGWIREHGANQISDCLAVETLHVRRYHVAR